MKLRIIMPFLLLAISNMAFAAEGVVTVASGYSVQETADRFEAVLKAKGMTVFNRIDHKANAKSVGLSMKPAVLFVFGNPLIGTNLMNCSETAALDLPQKMLIHEDAQQKVSLVYNDPQFMQKRHNMKGCEAVVEKVSKALGKLSQAAVK